MAALLGSDQSPGGDHKPGRLPSGIAAMPVHALVG